MKNGWEIKTLKDLCESIRDGSHNPPKGISSSEYLMLSSQNVQNGYLEMDKVRYLSESDFIAEDSRTKAKKGDVLLTIVGTIGRTCVLDGNDGKITFQRSVAILSPKAGVDSRFLMYGLMSLNDYLNNEATGAAQKGIYLKQLSRVSLKVPPFSKQQQIVALLDSAFTKIEALKATAENSLQNAKCLFQSALKEQLTPKAGWKAKTIDDVCSIYGRIGFRGYTRADLVNSPDEGAISLSPSNIINSEMNYDNCTYISWFKYEESPEIMIYENDILLVKTGSSYGKCAIVRHLPHKATINPQFVVLKDIKINRHFLWYSLCTPYAKRCFDQFVSGAAIPTFSQKNLGMMSIAVPPESEQSIIVSHLDELNSKCTSLQENYNKTLALCDDLKQSLLRKAFNGEL